MSNIAKRIAQCEAKMPFYTKGGALKFADKRGGLAQKAYKCDICGEWHLTKNNA